MKEITIMLYDENKINLNLLKQFKSNFLNEKNLFSNGAYSTFNSGYLNTCSDEYIRLIASKLDNLYKNIDESYTNILKWIEEYIENANGLELFLSKNTGSSFVSDSIIRNFLNSKLSNLSKNDFYKLDFVENSSKINIDETNDLDFIKI